MKILWESDWQGAKIEQNITYLSWIQHCEKPDHGLLGVGTDTGSVGVTMTDLKPSPDDMNRYNFNLRGHHSHIKMVTWNKSQSKLASCDSSGIIYVWVRNEDRWSVELVNDRGVKVSDLSWSPCGGSALICYEDNFVLIGSANGQRVWSNSFPGAATVTCGVWAADSKQLVIGFSSGTIQVLSSQGANITERSFTDERLMQMAFSAVRDDTKEWTLAMLTCNNKIIMISAYDQINSLVYRSPFHISRMVWNNEGTILACINSNFELVMLDTQCRVIHRERIAVPENEKKLTAITWAHSGNVIIVAAGGWITVGRILFGVPTLFDIVTYDVWKMMGCSSKRVDKLPIPLKEMNALRELDHHVIRCRIPRAQNLCSFVCSVVEARCYCTIRPMARGSNTYVLCFEHLGGLVPLLIGRQVNRFLPQFQIFLYQQEHEIPEKPPRWGNYGFAPQVEDIHSIIRSHNRNSLWRRSKRQIRAIMSKHVRPVRPDCRLLQVSSNVWCTKFNISSMSPTLLPSFLGQVVYKTSVLHLQPRQMTIDLAVLKRKNNIELSESSNPFSDANTQEGHAGPSSDKGLTSEERQFFEKVLAECLSLKAAMNSSNVHKKEPQPETSTACKPSTSTNAPSTSAQTTPLSHRTMESKLDVTSMASSVSTWYEEIETLAYIDGEDEKALLATPSKSNNVWGIEMANKKDAEVIRSQVDKLASIAEQLSKKHGDFNVKKDKASINKMRSQMKTLLRRVNEIEQKVANDDVKTEVRQLVRTLEEMKKTLGESGTKNMRHDSLFKTESMQNKTPFWNEHNQVYQLDFGGRVTQESAKNFQIELNNNQVLQFGRIEGGSYTLDFKYPFSAAQAFAVALASITQRLK
uniref:Tub domain-containing protein n=1 Tax=Caenorhabditis japonica TaxID=281687 RepID=A0A8R1HTZ3_CAEJA